MAGTFGSPIQRGTTVLAVIQSQFRYLPTNFVLGSSKNRKTSFLPIERNAKIGYDVLTSEIQNFYKNFQKQTICASEDIIFSMIKKSVNFIFGFSDSTDNVSMFDQFTNVCETSLSFRKNSLCQCFFIIWNKF